MRTLRKWLVRIVIWSTLFLIVTDIFNFADRAAKLVDPNGTIPPNADAIVVLTGGGDRIYRGAELANAHNLPLFISGVHPDATPEAVAEAAGVSVEFFNCCVTLGYIAQTTEENGQEIADWANQKDYTTLILVTSHYHLERALLEARTAMPHSEILGFAVASPTIKTAGWWYDLKSIRRIGLEWFKWRVVELRTGLLQPDA